MVIGALIHFTVCKHATATNGGDRAAKKGALKKETVEKGTFTFDHLKGCTDAVPAAAAAVLIRTEEQTRHRKRATGAGEDREHGNGAKYKSTTLGIVTG